MTKVTALIIGIDGWDEYTNPLVGSIKEHEPGCKIVVVDNASDPAYPSKTNVLRTQRLSYGAAINRAVAKAAKSDWYIVLNNDVLCDGPFIDALPDEPCIAGPLHKNRYGVHYVDAWLMAIHGKVWRDIGEWDEGFTMSSYGDVDYCLRAAKAGYELARIEIPFTHLESHQRVGLPGFVKADLENESYFKRKHNV